MNMDNGKSIENFNDIPEFYKEIINCWVEFGYLLNKICDIEKKKMKFFKWSNWLCHA
jgi:hypothetical protein